jgi:hypothetical protein
MSVKRNGFHAKVGDLIELLIIMETARHVRMPKINGLIIDLYGDPVTLILLDDNGKKLTLSSEYDFKVGLDWEVTILN